MTKKQMTTFNVIAMSVCYLASGYFAYIVDWRIIPALFFLLMAHNFERAIKEDS